MALKPIIRKIPLVLLPVVLVFCANNDKFETEKEKIENDSASKCYTHCVIQIPEQTEMHSLQLENFLQKTFKDSINSNEYDLKCDAEFILEMLSPEANTLKISLSTNQGCDCATILNQSIDGYIDLTVKQEYKTINNIIDYINYQLDSIANDLKKQEDSVLQAKNTNNANSYSKIKSEYEINQKYFSLLMEKKTEYSINQAKITSKIVVLEKAL